MPLSPNTTILDGKYTIIRRLGKGAFARVWLAEDHAVGQQVAIKELRHAELSHDEFVDLSRRFQREAKIGRALEHPNIIRVFTVEQWDEDLLLVMEYVAGETLRERLDRLGPMGLETALDVAVQLCAALDAVHAHALGIVHRDVKPSNILLTERGGAKLRAKLTDFGLAQLAAESGRSFGSGRHHPGTPLYMAPEQERGFGYLTGRADIYALGLVVGEMLIGRPAKPRLLEGETWADLLIREPAWLAEALQKATAREWEARYRQAGELKGALQAGLRGEAETRERARRDAEKQAGQEKLAKLYGELQTTLQAKRWQEAIRHCDDIAALDASYRNVAQLRAQAEAGLRAGREAAERRKQKQAELTRLHAAAQAASAAEDWGTVLSRCEEIERLEPGYRDVGQIKAQAQIAQQREAERRERQQRAANAAAVRSQPAGQPSSKPFPWTAVLGAAAAVVVIIAAIWGTRGCGGTPMPVVIEKVVKETVLVEVTGAPEEATEPPPTPRAATDTPRPEPSAAPRPATNTPRPAMATSVPPTATRRPTDTPVPATPTPLPDAVVGTENLNLRAGPGTVYPVVQSYAEGASMGVLGKSPAEDWLSVRMDDGQMGWMSLSLLEVNVPLAAVPVAEAPTTPTPAVPLPGATRVWEKDGSVMVYVPAGEFIMGSPEGEGGDDEHPQHTVYVDAFWIDRTEVTNAVYGAFLNDRGNQSEGGVTWLDAEDEDAGIERSGGEWRAKAGYENHPVIEVSWYGAVAYCQWAGKRLPTEAEWEKAARGTDEREYPWGNETATCEYAVMDDGSGYGCGRGNAAWAVGSKPKGASPYGALDMAGNVSEWCQDWFSWDYYDSTAQRNPQGPGSGEYRVVRGGSWYYRGRYVRAASRHRYAPDYRNYNVGFRCVSLSP